MAILGLQDCNIHGVWAYLVDPKLCGWRLCCHFFWGGFTVGEVPISTSFHRKVHLLEQGGAQVVPLHPAMEDSWGDGGGNMWKP